MHFSKKKKKKKLQLHIPHMAPLPQGNLRFIFFCDQNNGMINSTVWQGSEHFIKGGKKRQKKNKFPHDCMIVLWLPGVTLQHSFSQGT